MAASARPRARDLGVVIGLLPTGTRNAITDVAGVRVGHSTLISGDGPLRVGEGPVRTGVTVVLPPGEPGGALFAGAHVLNGNGEMTGLEWVRASGMLTTPVAITNTHSVGVVRDALVAAEVKRRGDGDGETFWSLPVVGETYDGQLSDMDGQHVGPEHVEAALDSASAGPPAEGNVGGGTGMICHEFKGGIGTSSRLVPEASGGYAVGALVQANYGRRERLTVAGVPVGRLIPTSDVPSAWDDVRTLTGAGSIIVVLATDAPLLPHQCAALAQRAGLGVARVGGAGERSSGDIFLAFATGNRLSLADPAAARDVTLVSDAVLSQLFWGAIEATEEAIVNALVAAQTMVGRDGITAHALPHDRLRELFPEHWG